MLPKRVPTQINAYLTNVFCKVSCFIGPAPREWFRMVYVCVQQYNVCSYSPIFYWKLKRLYFIMPWTALCLHLLRRSCTFIHTQLCVKPHKHAGVAPSPGCSVCLRSPSCRTWLSIISQSCAPSLLPQSHGPSVPSKYPNKFKCNAAKWDHLHVPFLFNHIYHLTLWPSLTNGTQGGGGGNGRSLIPVTRAWGRERKKESGRRSS